MRLTLIHPCVGRRVGERYIRTWQMEPLAPAVLAGLTPPGIDVRFFDDRMETIPYDEPTDLAAMSVETYTARRAYQIAGEYRRRGVPVVMGGFHATLATAEVSRYAEAVVVGEAEGVWRQVIEDAAAGGLQRRYGAPDRPSLAGVHPDRSIFAGKSYLPLGLIEAGRGCHLRCEFCAVQTVFGATQTRRPAGEIVEEIRRMNKPVYFFVDDNITSNMDQAKEFFHALIPLKIRWVSQASLHAAHDREFLELIKAAGCQALLIGIETLNVENLRRMRKMFNAADGGPEAAVTKFREAGIRLYATFILGYDEDTGAAFREAAEFADRHRLYMAAFNHLTPFPGTPLYRRFEEEGRLLYDAWWLDPRYRYGQVPFRPRHLTPEQVQDECVRARAAFYGLPSMFRRGLDFRVNANNVFMWRNFYVINWLMRREVYQRNDMPLGDAGDQSPLLECGLPPLEPVAAAAAGPAWTSS